jgi:hypothetical protein
MEAMMHRPGGPSIRATDSIGSRVENLEIRNRARRNREADRLLPRAMVLA